MCKLGELSKFLDYSSNVLEISSQLIWNIPVTYWKFPVGSKMILLFLDMFEAFKNSEKNRISLFHVSLPILTIKPSIYKGFSKLERILIMVLCIFKLLTGRYQRVLSIFILLVKIWNNIKGVGKKNVLLKTTPMRLFLQLKTCKKAGSF